MGEGKRSMEKIQLKNLLVLHYLYKIYIKIFFISLCKRNLNLACGGLFPAFSVLHT